MGKKGNTRVENWNRVTVIEFSVRRTNEGTSSLVSCSIFPISVLLLKVGEGGGNTYCGSCCPKYAVCGWAPMYSFMLTLLVLAPLNLRGCAGSGGFIGVMLD